MRNLFCLSSVICAICIGLTKANELELTKSNDIFRNKLDEILTDRTKKNTLFSPLSLHAALSLLYLSAEGKTRKVMKEVLNLGGPKETAADYEVLLENLRSMKNVTLDIATKLFVSHALTLEKEFKSLALQYYSTEEENVDFRNKSNAALRINNWVSEKTKHNIEKIIQPSSIDKKTRLIIVNAVYFKGNWLHRFSLSNTIRESFFVSEDRYVESKMMSVRKAFHYAENKDLDAKIVRLPYTNDKFGLIIVLPNKRMGYADLEKKLRKTNSSVFRNLKLETGRVVLPKFQVNKEIDLKKPLSKLGLDIIFSHDATFPHIAYGCYVDKVKQKLVFKVDSNGTEASAVTLLEMLPRTVGGEVPINFRFIADHPFLFFLEYSTSAGSHILFQGRVTEV